jgi:DHA1 family tetracycline resistance protein-like MFS transporter
MTHRPAAARFIFITLFLDVLGLGLVVPILPALVTEFVGGDASLGAAWYGPIVASYALMQFIAAPFLGALSDRFGRRPVLLLALLGYGIDYIILGFAPTLTWLIIGRMLAGITGASYTTAAAYLADISTPETRAANFGLIGAAFGLGFIAGPALGGLLGELGPRVPFFVAAALVLLNVLYGVFVLPESLPVEKRRPLDVRDLNPFRAIVGLWRVAGLGGLIVTFVIAVMAQRGLESLWVLHNEYRYGWGPLENGGSLALVGLSAAIVQGGLIRRVVPRIGERSAVLFGLLGAAVAQVIFGFAPSGPWILIGIPFAALSGFAIPTLQGIVAGQVPDDQQGTVQGALTSVLALVAVVAPLVSTAVFTATTGDSAVELPGAVFFVHAGLYVVAAGVSVWALRVLQNSGRSNALQVSDIPETEVQQ